LRGRQSALVGGSYYCAGGFGSIALPPLAGSPPDGIDRCGGNILAPSPQLRELAHLDIRDNLCRDPVDAAAGYGVDGISGFMVPASIYLPDFGRDLEARYGRIDWLHALSRFMEKHPPNRHQIDRPSCGGLWKV
jgi:hypothetical protein